MMHIHGYPVAYGVVALAAGLGLWHFKWLHRVAMVFFALALALFVLGITPLEDALARLTSTGTGLVVLVVVAVPLAFATAYEMRNKRKNGRLYSHICAGVFAIVGVLIVANAARLLSEAAHSPARAGRALAQTVHEIRSGTAAHAQTSHQAITVVVIALAVLVVAVIIGWRHEHRTGRGTTGPRAITSGSPALPSGRKGG